MCAHAWAGLNIQSNFGLCRRLPGHEGGFDDSVCVDHPIQVVNLVLQDAGLHSVDLHIIKQSGSILLTKGGQHSI